MSFCGREEKCFTFLWKIKNASFCLQKKGEQIRSPSFVVDEIEETKWNLSIYPRGKGDENFIGFFLNREGDSEGVDPVAITYELAFIANDGTVIVNKGKKKGNFYKDKGFGCANFLKREAVFIARKSSSITQNTLRARCRIWTSDEEMIDDAQCTAVTRIGVEKRSLKWNVKKFSILEQVTKCSYQIESIENDMPLMSVDLSLREGLSSDENIRFNLFLHDQTIKYSTLILFLIDNLGDKVECNQEEICFEDPPQHKELTFTFSKQTLLEKKRVYLPEDTLSLVWEWAFSRGIASQETEEDEYVCICPEEKFSDPQNITNDKTSRFNVLVDNMKSLYDEHFLSDIKLKTNTSVFPAHKFVLSAQSSVFKRMFSSDMKEADSGCVKIEDLSDDSITRLLLFVYTTRVDNLTWESASDLYVAADKYAIFSLKHICASYMKDNLDPCNACQVLLLSDFHADDELKSAAQDYILKHGKQITNSDEWKTLVETNAKLAVETVCLLFK